MKSSLISLNEIPPALEIARAIGVVPLSWIGTALIRSARPTGDSDVNDTPEAIAASCRRPIATGESCTALRSQVENDCFPFGGATRAIRSLISHSGRNAIRRVAGPKAALA